MTRGMGRLWKPDGKLKGEKRTAEGNIPLGAGCLNPALESYVNYFLNDGYKDGVENAFGPGVGYVALPPDVKSETDAAWEQAKK